MNYQNLARAQAQGQGRAAAVEWLWIVSLVLLVPLTSGCSAASQTPPPNPPPSSPPAPVREPAPEPPGVSEPATPEVQLDQLLIDADKSVRIKGRITAILGMRLVPPKLIFQISDGSRTITALIKEQVQLNEGDSIELVGKYFEVPAPMHDGPGQPALEAVFVVERFLTLP